MYYCPKRRRWRLFFEDDHGKRRAKDFETEKEAKRFERDLELGEVEVKTFGVRSPTFREFSERWLRDYCRIEKAESQWRLDEQNIARHLLPALGNRKLLDLNKAHLLDLRAELKRKTVGKQKPKAINPKTVNNVVGLAKKMLGTAVELGLMPSNPWAGVRPLKVPERTFQFWTLAELDEFSTEAMALNPRLTRLVQVAFHTGLRAGELCALRVGDLDLTRGQVCVQATHNLNTGERYERTKNGRVAFVPLNRAAIEALEPARFLKPDDYVFDRALFWNLRKRFGELAVEVGSRPIRFHDLRHSFASNLAMAGVDLMKIQRLMRHRSYQMTLRYAHLHPDHLKGATDILCTRPAPEEVKRLKSGAPRGT